MTQSGELVVLYFTSRRELAAFLGQLDVCLTYNRGHGYDGRSPELELWACTDVVTADTLCASGPSLYANEAVMRCVAAAGLNWTYAGRVERLDLPANSWPVLGGDPHGPVPERFDPGVAGRPEAQSARDR